MSAGSNWNWTFRHYWKDCEHLTYCRKNIRQLNGIAALVREIVGARFKAANSWYIVIRVNVTDIDSRRFELAK